MSEISSDELYTQYAETLSALTDRELDVLNQRRLLADLRRQILKTEDASYGLEITDHVFRQIAERLEEEAMAHTSVYDDVFNVGEPHKSLIVPSNLKSFLINMIAIARKEKTFDKKTSRNGGIEFKYVVTISKWNTEHQEMQLTIIVENHAIKTAFFNLV